MRVGVIAGFFVYTTKLEEYVLPRGVVTWLGFVNKKTPCLFSATKGGGVLFVLGKFKQSAHKP